MAKKNDKKYKYTVLENKELESQTIGVINNKKNPIVLIIIFIIFIAVIVFLPNITEYIKTYMNKETVTPIKREEPQVEEEPKQNEEEPKEELKYIIANDLIIDLDTMKITEFVKDNNSLSFTINNKLNNPLNINDYSYYIEFYDVNNMLLERIKFENVNIEVNKNYIYKTTINENTSTLLNNIMIKEIKEIEYPAIELDVNNEGYQILTCDNTIEKNIYFFKNNQLLMIRKIVNLKNSIENYENLYIKYSDYKTFYNNKEGYTLSFTDLKDGFLLSLVVELNNVKELLDDQYYYDLNTESKIINFEMISRNFTCN